MKPYQVLTIGREDILPRMISAEKNSIETFSAVLRMLRQVQFLNNIQLVLVNSVNLNVYKKKLN